jgi:hypothetical protein
MDVELYKKERKNIEIIIENINNTHYLKAITVATRAKTAHSSFEKMNMYVGETGSWIMNLYNNMWIWFLIIFPWDFALYWGMLIAAFNNYFRINFTEISCHDEIKERVVEKVVEIPEKVIAVAEKIPEESSVWDTVSCILIPAGCTYDAAKEYIVKSMAESAIEKTKTIKEVQKYSDTICIDIIPQWVEYAPQLTIVSLLIVFYVITSYTMKKFILFRIRNQKNRLKKLFKEREIEQSRQEAK